MNYSIPTREEERQKNQNKNLALSLSDKNGVAHKTIGAGDGKPSIQPFDFRKIVDRRKEEGVTKRIRIRGDSRGKGEDMLFVLWARSIKHSVNRRKAENSHDSQSS